MPKKIYERLSTLSFSRPSGTEFEKKAADYLLSEIEKIGFSPEVEEFTYTRKIPVDAELFAISQNGEEISFPVTGVIDSKETPANGETAGFYYLKSFDEVSLSRIYGKVVLIHDRLSAEKYKKLVDAGIAGYITTSGTIRDTYENSDLETGRFRDNLKDIGPVPAFSIRMIDAVKLLKLRPKEVRIKLILKEEKVTSRNLVVSLKGYGDLDEQLVVGAHYDSVPFSLGSWDNGAGAVEILALLEKLKDSQPKRDIKVVLFGSEETGLKGSRAYVKAHEKDIAKTRAMVNVDVGGSILGNETIFIGASDDTQIFVQHFLKEVGYEAVTIDKLMSSDSANFNYAGVPSISIGQGLVRGGGYMHTRYDNMDLIDEDVLAMEADFLIKLVQKLDASIVFPFPRIIPEKLQKEIDEYFGKGEA